MSIIPGGLPIIRGGSVPEQAYRMVRGSVHHDEIMTVDLVAARSVRHYPR